MEQEITTFRMEEHMRKRPGMYIGGTDLKAFLNLLESALEDFRVLFNTDRFFVSIQFHNHYISLSITGNVNALPVMDILRADCSGYAFIKALMALSERFEAQVQNKTQVFICGNPDASNPIFNFDEGAAVSFAFVPDATIFKNLQPDFHSLCEKLKRFAMLNSNMQLLLRDTRALHASQLYYHYADGIKQLFYNTINQKHSGNRFALFIDTRSKQYAYQLGIGFNRALWATETLSFANHIHTYEGGSLEHGVLNGVIKALKMYTQQFAHRRFRFSRRQLKQGLTQVLAVKGEDMIFAGCTRAELEMAQVKKETSALAYRALLNYLEQNSTEAEEFISMFETTTYVQTVRNLTHCTMACLVAKKRELILAD